MSFTDLFIKRPVVATVVNLIIFIAGYQAIRSINVRQYPRSDLSVITEPGCQGLSRFFDCGDDQADLVLTCLWLPSLVVVEYVRFSPSPAALAQIQTKVEQVRNQLPPASQLPTLQITSTDNQFASMYLSFFSNDLGRNQITDYLTRVVQPKL